MIRLDSVTRSLEAVLSGTVVTTQPSFLASWSDATSTGYAGGSTPGSMNSAVAVTIVSAPASGVVRDVDYVVISNSDTAEVTVTIRYNDNTTIYPILTVTLAAGSTLNYTHAKGWEVLEKDGSAKTGTTGPQGIQGVPGPALAAMEDCGWYEPSLGNVKNKTDVGLGNVDNTSDVNKPVSTAQQTALDLKAPLASPVFSGNVGIGVTPSAWGSSYSPALDIGSAGAIAAYSTAGLTIYDNSYVNSTPQNIYKTSAAAAKYQIINGSHYWYSAPSGTAGTAITFTQTMTLDASGNLLVGVTSGSYHILSKGSTENTKVLSVGGAAAFYVGSDTSWNAAATAIQAAKNSTTSRSINAAGTINASGADYAEYEKNNGLTIAKSAIVGFKADGTLTMTFAEAIRFGVKSTNPSYVGGDVWGTEEQVGKRPDEPIYTAPEYTGSADPGEQPQAPVQGADESDTDFSAREQQYQTDLSAWQTAEAQYQADQAAYQKQVADAEAAHAAAMTMYQTDLTAWEATLEAARRLVDRIAYSGKVPVNVNGATPGQYIIAVAAADGSIDGQAVSDPDFAQYKLAVGRVNRILDDGRAEVAVIIH